MGKVFDGDGDYIGPYLRYLADNMGLRDWHIHPPGNATPQAEYGLPDTARACCVTEYGQKVMHICFREDWTDQDEDSFRWLCVHELLHAHFRIVEQPLHSARDMIGTLAFTPIMDSFKSAMEYTIDGIAYDWGRLLPLPSEWLDMETSHY